MQLGAKITFTPLHRTSKKDVYLQYSPFVHHGAPWCQSMIDIYGKKKVIAIMPEAVVHEGKQTINVVNRDWLDNWHVPRKRN